ncbi:MAG: tyrosine-type recombinase/integrase [Alphaproteobacteria bacterium]
MKRNVENCYLRYDFEVYLREAKGFSEKTIQSRGKALAYFDKFLEERDYKTIKKEDLIAFKKHIREYKTKNNSTPSSSLLVQITSGLKDFMNWLRDAKGHKNLTMPLIEYINLTKEERAMATAPKRQIPPTLNDVEKIVSIMPCATDKHKRDRAIVVFLALTGIREKALMTLRVKSFDAEKMSVWQHIREGVEMKHNSSGLTTMLPISEDLEKLFLDYYKYLTINKKFTAEMPLFPKMKIRQKQSDSLFETNGYLNEFIQSGQVIRDILKNACVFAGLKYINPHLMRNFASTHIFTNNETMRMIGAIKQNFTHLDLETTFGYASIPIPQQISIIRGMKL